MTYFNVDLKHLRVPSRKEWGDVIVGGFIVAVALLALGGYIG